MLNTPHTFIFIGRSGSGKGTQAELLKSFLVASDSRAIQYIQTGQRFRDFIQSDTYTAGLAKKVLDTGALMPEFLGVWNWSSIFVDKVMGDEHMILDGMPRRLREAHILDSAMEFYGREMPLVIHIDILEDTARKRLLGRAREDDVDIEIERRLAWFNTDVEPVIENYTRDRKYNFIRIDGELTEQEIAENIKTEFKKLYGYNN